MSFLDFLIVAGLLFANAFFVAAEFALVKVRTSQIERMAERGHWAAKITSRLIDRLDAYLSASQLGITLASLGLGWAIHDSVEPFVESVLHAVGLSGSLLIAGTSVGVVATVSFLFVTFLHIALGELVPKSLAIRAARPVSLWTAPPLMAFYYLFFPIIWVLNKASDLVLWLVGLGSPDHAELVHTEEELRHILGESAAGGYLSRNERVMIENVLNLEDKIARRVMVPRPDVVYLSLARPLEDNLRLARQAGHTRYPLCQDDLTTVLGMIHVKDLFRAGAAPNGRPDLTKLARPIPTLPDTIHLDRLLVEFQRERVHVAMLADERGAIVGMVALENVLEELVGPIQDEFDREQPRIASAGEGIFEIDATCPLDVLADTCGVSLPETEAETAAGLVLDQLGRLARVGDHVDVGQHRLTVIQADPTRIRRLRVEPAPPAGATAPGEAQDERMD
jgi:CBS domain containing-hemolysin-like protein